MMRLFGGATGALFGHFANRKARLDKDRDQHHLASMLISIAAGRNEVDRADIYLLFHAKGWSQAEISVRINHAVTLAGTAVAADLYDAVVRLAREILAR